MIAFILSDMQIGANKSTFWAAMLCENIGELFAHGWFMWQGNDM